MCEHWLERKRQIQRGTHGKTAWPVQDIPFPVSRGECQEPDPKSSAVCSLDSSIKVLFLYHRYPAHCTACCPSASHSSHTHPLSLLWKHTTTHSFANTYCCRFMCLRKAATFGKQTCCPVLKRQNKTMRRISRG